MSRPKLMTIGDSLAQGTQSLSVTPETTSQSLSAIVCKHFNWEYQNYEANIPILFDLEEDFFRRVGILTLPVTLLEIVALFHRIGRNMDQWFDRFFETRRILPGVPEFLDNIAVAGSVVPNLIETTASESRKRFKTLYKEIKDSAGVVKIDDLLTRIADLHGLINYSYVLNPSNRPRFNNVTPLGYVALREPENLVISIGPNHGLFQMGFEATYDKTAFENTRKAWERLAEELKSACANVDKVLFSLLPKVSAVANLHPLTDHPSNGYFKKYRPRLVPVKNTVTGDELREFDAKVRELNKRGREIFRDALKDKVKFIDTYKITRSFDTKNQVRGSNPIQIRDRRGKRDYSATNDSLRVTQRVRHRPKGPLKRFPPKLAEGGLFSMDGMHPSGLGYAVFAAEYIQALGGKADTESLYADAFLNDRYLSRPDLSVNDVFKLVNLIRNIVPESSPPDGSIHDSEEESEPSVEQTRMKEFIVQTVRIHCSSHS